ncbi:hypothetical protein ACFYZB_23550 [Streptomyces sp. NPDC001852]|uniref:hypothetical protein n=1 Tax=Streptomyces sp. NPDC001852 TaxID=3364619 RepID=UPI0036780975
MWEHESGSVEGHEGSARGALADGIRFTFRAGAVLFDGDEHADEGGQPEVRDPRIDHLNPLCACGWRGDNVPVPGSLEPTTGDGHSGWTVPEDAAAPVRQLWQQHVTAVRGAAVPAWHTIRWAEQNLALREVTAQQPIAALRLLRKIMSDAEAHQLAAVRWACEWGVPWTDLAAQLGLDEDGVRDLHARAVNGF